MSNLKNNNAALEALIEQVKALPEAGSGGTVETCTVHIYSMNTHYIAYSKADGAAEFLFVSNINSDYSGTDITCICGSMLAVSAANYISSYTMSDNLTELGKNNYDDTIYLHAPQQAGASASFVFNQ